MKFSYRRQEGRSWDSSLFGCFADPGLCLWASYCPLNTCTLQDIAIDQVTNEGLCLSAALSCCLGTIGNAINRNRLREVLGIKGNIFCDCLIWFCFPTCAGIQEYREAKLSRQKTISISLENL